MKLKDAKSAAGSFRRKRTCLKRRKSLSIKCAKVLQETAFEVCCLFGKLRFNSAMEYTLQTPAFLGETVALYSIAFAMANHRANASGSGFHKHTFDGAISQYTNVLVNAAERGHLKVCNQFGDPGTPDEILEDATSRKGVVRAIGKESLTLAVHVFVRLHHLNIWAQEQGDIFRVELVGWADERGHVSPSKPGKAKESPQANDFGGSQTVATADDAEVPVHASSVAEPGLSTTEIAQCFDGVNDWSSKRWSKNLSSAKWLQPSRIRAGVVGGVSGIWNPLTLVQLLYSRAKSDRAKHSFIRILRARFKQNPILKPWSDDVNEYFDTYGDTN